MLEIPTTIKNKELVEKRREQIILAAIRLFSKKGFHKTTLREIAAEAAISQGSIYDYIGTKEDIFFLIHDYLASLVQRRLVQTMDKAADPMFKLKEIIRAEFEMMHEWSDAVLLIYQESHNLSGPLRKSLLEKEKSHAEIYEDVVRECMAQWAFRHFDHRCVAALMLGAIHTYVLRRWDLNKYASITEIERLITELFFHGLIQDGVHEGDRARREAKPLDGKRVLIIHGTAGIGRSLVPFLLGKGAHLAIHADSVISESDYFGCEPGDLDRIRFYLTKDYGELTSHLFDRVVEDLGEINAVIHHLDTNDPAMMPHSISRGSENTRVESNYRCAENLPDLLERSMSKSGSGRVVYVAPWAWDRHVTPLNYEILKAGTAALTRAMAKQLAPSGITVNCVVPGFVSGVHPSEHKGDRIAEFMNTVPLKERGDIQDVGEAICYYLSDAGRNVTGQILEIAGGAG